MAKKKKPTKGRKGKAARQASPVWQYVGAIILILTSVFMLLGSINTGGNLPLMLFDAAHEAVGLAAYIIPVGLMFWGIYKLSNGSHHLARGRFWSLAASYLFAAGFLHAATASKGLTAPVTGSDSVDWAGGQGGAVGAWFGNLVLSALDQFPASILFLIFFIPLTLYAYGIPFDSALAWLKSLRHQPDQKRKDTDLVALKKRGKLDQPAPEPKLSWRERRAQVKAARVDGIPGLQVNGMTEQLPEEPPQKRGSLKDSAQRLGLPTSGDAQAAALTMASDPDWKLPEVSLLNQKENRPDPGNINETAELITKTFNDFNIDVEVREANTGPRVTQYAFSPPSNVKLTKLTSLENNLALNLAATSIRIEAPIPGKSLVGIELPNKKPGSVPIASMFKSQAWAGALDKPLTFAIGRDIANAPIFEDLAKMPHLLIAGQTGSGKSVMINTLLTSLLYHNSPSDLKLILVDPKQVEMAPYNDIPHLLCPVINEPEKCISALKWAVAEMERRLRTMAEVGKRNIGEYNNLKKEEGMPYIVVVIDELADLMMMAARDVEALIVRLAQKARAVGIHLVLATQRPSVDVITGLIKANVPARIAFTVASQVDSRTIIDQMGAEKLLGMGDMLLLTSGMNKPIRLQAAFISDDETAKITDYIKMQRPPQYDMDIISQPVQLNGKGGVVAEMGGGDAEGDMFRDAVRVVIEGKKASTSLLQRRLRIGYGRAARLIEEMEEQGIIGAADGSRPREVLVSSLEQVFGGGDDAGDDGGDGGQGPIGSRAGS